MLKITKKMKQQKKQGICSPTKKMNAEHFFYASFPKPRFEPINFANIPHLNVLTITKRKKKQKKQKNNLLFADYLSGQDDGQSSQERDVPVVKSFNNVYDHDCICIPITEGHAGIGEDGDEYMLFHIERPRVKAQLCAE